jgi:hypothetical protein
MKKAQLLCGIAVSALTAISHPALAADAADSTTQVGEVIVTATRDARALREVPVARILGAASV